MTHAFELIRKFVDAALHEDYFGHLFNGSTAAMTLRRFQLYYLACREHEVLHALIRMPWSKAERVKLQDYLVLHQRHVLSLHFLSSLAINYSI